MINRVILVGRLARDPELRYAGNGTAVTKFTIACDRPNGEEADFIQVVTFKKTAEACAEYLKKGLLVGVEGRWQTGHYDNSEGKRVYTNDCIADNVKFLERGESKNNASAESKQNNDPFQDDGTPIDISDDSLPF